LIKINVRAKQENAALRDFDLAYVGSGSWLCENEI
jgi:hypothetical protein